MHGSIVCTCMMVCRPKRSPPPTAPLPLPPPPPPPPAPACHPPADSLSPPPLLKFAISARTPEPPTEVTGAAGDAPLVTGTDLEVSRGDSRSNGVISSLNLMLTRCTDGEVVEEEEEAATGILAHVSKAAGFGSVSDLLKVHRDLDALQKLLPPKPPAGQRAPRAAAAAAAAAAGPGGEPKGATSKEAARREAAVEDGELPPRGDGRELPEGEDLGPALARALLLGLEQMPAAAVHKGKKEGCKTAGRYRLTRL